MPAPLSCYSVFVLLDGPLQRLLMKFDSTEEDATTPR